MDYSVSGEVQPTEPFEKTHDVIDVRGFEVRLEAAVLTVSFSAAAQKARAIALGEDVARCLSVERNYAVTWRPRDYHHPGGVDITITPDPAILYRPRPKLPANYIREATEDERLRSAVHYAELLVRTGSLHLAKNLLSQLRETTGLMAQEKADQQLAEWAGKPEAWFDDVGRSLAQQGHLTAGVVPNLAAREIRSRLILVLRALLNKHERVGPGG